MTTSRVLVGVIGLLVCLSILPPVTTVSAQEVVTLTVTVETPDGDPVPNAELNATWDGGSSTATTVSNGKAFIDVERGADVEITVDHPDYIRNQVYTLADAQEESIAITVHPRATAHVRITDSGGAVPQAVVTFRKGGSLVTRATTDSDGEIDVGPIESGQYQLSVRKSRYLTKTVETELSGDTSLEISIMKGSIPLTVNVTDDYFSPARPLAEVSIEVADVGTVQTQPNGIQQISVPVNTRLDIRVTKEGYGTIEQTLNVGESPIRLQVTLRRTPSLSLEAFSDQVVVGERLLVEVTDEYEDPVANATVMVDGDPVATTGDDGQATFDIESAGEHEITVRKGDLTSDAQTVKGVSAGETETTDRPTTQQTESPGQPGFGILVAVAGLLVAIGSVYRHLD